MVSFLLSDVVGGELGVDSRQSAARALALEVPDEKWL